MPTERINPSHSVWSDDNNRLNAHHVNHHATTKSGRTHAHVTAYVLSSGHVTVGVIATDRDTGHIGGTSIFLNREDAEELLKQLTLTLR